MRLAIQRVGSAKVEANGQVVGQIDKGLFVLVGIKIGDTKELVKMLADKLSRLRIMSDESDKMNLSVKDTGDSILAVSQFTLNANTKDGNRPSFIEAEEPGKARALYDYFIDRLRKNGIKVEIGSFGNYMKIECTLDGPVTIILE